MTSWDSSIAAAITGAGLAAELVANAALAHRMMQLAMRIRAERRIDRTSEGERGETDWENLGTRNPAMLAGFGEIGQAERSG